jgi:hypothetical protein
VAGRVRCQLLIGSVLEPLSQGSARVVQVIPAIGVTLGNPRRECPDRSARSHPLPLRLSLDHKGREGRVIDPLV